MGSILEKKILTLGRNYILDYLGGMFYRRLLGSFNLAHLALEFLFFVLMIDMLQSVG